MASSLPKYEASSFKTSWDDQDFLGKGGFAAVRRCNHGQLGKVAVKCFSLCGSSKDMEKITNDIDRELKVLCRLKHYHIVSILATTEWNNCKGIIMEYVDGCNLNSILYEHKEDFKDIPWLLRLRFPHQLAAALLYLHSKSFVHCDLKPLNILLTSHLIVKLADFGSVAIATATGATAPSVDIASNTQHTPFYTAPELLKDLSRKKHSKMDVYSFGIVLYEILTRCTAYSCNHFVKPFLIEYQIINDGQKPFPQYLDEVEASLKDQELEIFKFLNKIMVQCWDFELEKRPDISEVCDEIEEKLRLMNGFDVDYSLDDLKQKKDPEPAKISMKIELNGFLPPFMDGPQPSPAYLPIPAQSSSNSAMSIQDEVNGGSYTVQIRESSKNNETDAEMTSKEEPEHRTSETASDLSETLQVMKLTVNEGKSRSSDLKINVNSEISSSYKKQLPESKSSFFPRLTRSYEQTNAGDDKQMPTQMIVQAEVYDNEEANDEVADDLQIVLIKQSLLQPEVATSETSTLVKNNSNADVDNESIKESNHGSSVEDPKKAAASYKQRNDRELPTQMIVQAEVYDNEEANGEVADDLQIVLIKQSLLQPEVATSETSTLLQNNSNADVDNNESIAESNHGSSLEGPKKAASCSVGIDKEKFDEHAKTVCYYLYSSFYAFIVFCLLTCQSLLALICHLLNGGD
ncbi:unnamed protein product [Clavelina lepadiformis]|uniref:Protein kinase domain-containing protein n=1 Tax=Clavelina lepadiformis TaxID=159417 RepID=A0ABP0FR24_CLALP